MSGRRDGSKPTFAERDKRRRERGSRGGGRDDRGPRPDGPGAAQAQKSYRAALERAFAEGKVDELAATLARTRDPAPSAGPAAPAGSGRTPAGTPPAPAPPPATSTIVPGDPARAEKRELLAAIKSAENAEDAARAIDRWHKRFGDLPANAEILEKALGHRDPAVLRAALLALEGLISREKPRRSRTLIMQLSILEDTCADDELCALAARLRHALA